MINTRIRHGKPPVTLTHSRPFMPPVLQNKCRSRVDSVPLHPFEKHHRHGIPTVNHEQPAPALDPGRMMQKGKTRWSFNRYSSSFFLSLPCKTLIRSPTMHLLKKKVIHITDVKNSIFISSGKRLVAFHIYNRFRGKAP